MVDEAQEPFPDEITTGLHDQLDALEAAIEAARSTVDDVKGRIAKELVASRKGAELQDHIERAMAAAVIATAQGLRRVTTDAVKLGLRDGRKLRELSKKSGLL
jgi:hypothetical protein